MGTLIIAALLPAIPHIVAGIEALFGHGNGAAKKKAATALLGDAANSFATLANGTSANTSALMTLIGKEIDAVVEYMNTTGQFKHGASA